MMYVNWVSTRVRWVVSDRKICEDLSSKGLAIAIAAGLELALAAVERRNSVKHRRGQRHLSPVHLLLRELWRNSQDL